MVEGGPWTPGWYPDPMARAPYRWWDGSAWTDGLSDDMVRAWPDPHWVASPAAAPLPPPPDQATAGAQPEAPPKPAWYRTREARWLGAGGAVLVLLIAIASGGSGSDGTQDVATAPNASTTAAPRSTTTERIVTTTRATTTTSTTTTAPPTTTTTAPPATTAPPTTAPPTTAPPAPPTTVAAAPLAGGNCHPSYDPCVPYASDVDCLGGKGNGPAYTGRVSVIGPDEYDLDADGDGIGCDNS